MKPRGFLDRYPNKGVGIERVYKFHKNNKDKSKLPYDVNLKTHYDDCLELFRKYFVSKGIK